MNKLISRLAIFFIGLPLVLAMVFAPWYNHIVLHTLICVMVFFAANELYVLFSQKIALQKRWFVVCLSVLLPVIAGIHSVVPAFTGKPMPFGDEIISYCLVFTFIMILFAEVFFMRTFEDSIARITGSAVVILYSGYLITFVSRMTTFTLNGKSISTALIAVFLMMVFLCDSLAWFFGVLLGKNNKGFVKASPNKSIAGFIGGFIGSILAGVLGWFIWPDVFTGSIFKMVGIGIVIAATSVVGDLSESIIKRSAEMKDSGHIIPGRGGAMDSIDSIIMSAPFYYMLINLIYGPF